MRQGGLETTANLILGVRSDKHDTAMALGMVGFVYYSKGIDLSQFPRSSCSLPVAMVLWHSQYALFLMSLRLSTTAPPEPRFLFHRLSASSLPFEQHGQKMPQVKLGP